MKLKVISGETGEHFKIDVSKFDSVDHLKFRIPDGGTRIYLNEYINLIHKNIILSEKNLLSFYKMSEDDELWIGKVDKYLNDNQIIVEMFLSKAVPEYMWVIVNVHDSIAEIRAIIESVFYDSTDVKIWNRSGELMQNVRKVTEIDETLEYEKLIVSWQEDFGATFEQCSNIHDRYLLTEFSRIFGWYFIQPWAWVTRQNYDLTVDGMMEERNYFCERVLPKILDDAKLGVRLETMPCNFLKSRFLFWMNIADRIYEIFDDNFTLMKTEFTKVAYRTLSNEFHVALHVAVFDHLNSRESDKVHGERSMKNSVVEAVNYFMDPIMYWHHLMRMMNYFCLESQDESQVHMILDNGDDKYSFIHIKLEGSSVRVLMLPKAVKTVAQVQKAISIQFGVTSQELYLIEWGGDKKPKHEDVFEKLKYKRYSDDYFFEIVSRMDNIQNIKKLGQGAFGAVYLCEDTQSRKQFVLKKQLDNNKDFYREISIHSIFAESDKMTGFGGLYNDGGTICIAMEYMSGGTLYEYLMKYPLSERQIAKISAQILLQIEEMHKRKTIHRDIKADNIVLDEQCNAKLVDFGYSKSNKDLSVVKLLENLKVYKPGTLCYMAPEVLKCKSYTEKIDIWSFGATVIEMISGRRPFHNLTQIQAVMQIIKTNNIPYDPRQPVSDELNEFLQLCLKPDPTERASPKELMESKFIRKYME